MRRFGFSTGALAKSDIKKALRLSKTTGADAVEYSALRLEELRPLADYLLIHGVDPHYCYTAFHAPSKFDRNSEKEIVDLLKRLVDELNFYVVVHPDAIHDHSLWRQLGNKLCVENMDHRKPIGRTADELSEIFLKLPEAKLCFDIGHAHEIDRSMLQAYEILKNYRNRISHIHASEVTDECNHKAFSPSSLSAFSIVKDMIPAKTPIILETVTPDDEVKEQLEEAMSVFGNRGKLPPKRKVRKKKS